MKIQEAINVDNDGCAYTITARYSAMSSTNVMGGGHYPMTAVVERDESTPPLPKNLDIPNTPHTGGGTTAQYVLEIYDDEEKRSAPDR